MTHSLLDDDNNNNNNHNDNDNHNNHNDNNNNSNSSRHNPKPKHKYKHTWHSDAHANHFVVVSTCGALCSEEKGEPQAKPLMEERKEQQRMQKRSEERSWVESPTRICRREQEERQQRRPRIEPRLHRRRCKFAMPPVNLFPPLLLLLVVSCGTPCDAFPSYLVVDRSSCDIELEEGEVIMNQEVKAASDPPALAIEWEEEGNDENQKNGITEDKDHKWILDPSFSEWNLRLELSSGGGLSQVAYIMETRAYSPRAEAERKIKEQNDKFYDARPQHIPNMAAFTSPSQGCEGRRAHGRHSPHDKGLTLKITKPSDEYQHDNVVIQIWGGWATGYQAVTLLPVLEFYWHGASSKEAEDEQQHRHAPPMAEEDPELQVTVEEEVGGLDEVIQHEMEVYDQEEQEQHDLVQKEATKEDPVQRKRTATVETTGGGGGKGGNEKAPQHDVPEKEPLETKEKEHSKKDKPESWKDLVGGAGFVHRVKKKLHRIRKNLPTAKPRTDKKKGKEEEHHHHHPPSSSGNKATAKAMEEKYRRQQEEEEEEAKKTVALDAMRESRKRRREAFHQKEAAGEKEKASSKPSQHKDEEIPPVSREQVRLLHEGMKMKNLAIRQHISRHEETHKKHGHHHHHHHHWDAWEWLWGPATPPVSIDEQFHFDTYIWGVLYLSTLVFLTWRLMLVVKVRNSKREV